MAPLSQDKSKTRDRPYPAPLYGWKAPTVTASSNSNVIGSPVGDVFSEDLNSRLKKAFLVTLCKRPTVGLTEVRRDGKDNMAVAKVIRKEYIHRMDIMEQPDFIRHMHTYASACWVRISRTRLVTYHYFHRP